MGEQDHPRKRRSRWPVVLIGLLVLFVLGAAGWLAWRVVRFLREPLLAMTTPLSDGGALEGLPRKADGTIDFLAAYNAEFGEGVAPEDNAAVALFGALGTDLFAGISDLPQDELLAEFRAAWGMADGPAPEGRWISFADFAPSADLAALVGTDVSDEDAVEALLSACADEPWEREEHPVVAAWLDANRELLRLIGDASRREKWFWPAIAEDGPTVLFGTESPDWGLVREIDWALAGRAMMALAQGDAGAACADALTLHRLGGLFFQDGALIGPLMGVNTGWAACGVSLTLATRGRANAQVERALLDGMLSLPEPVALLRVLDTRDRWETLEYFVDRALWDGVPLTPQDTAVAFGVINGWCDRATEAAKLPTWPEKVAAFDAIDADAEAAEKEMGSFASSLLKLTQSSPAEQRHALGRLLGTSAWCIAGGSRKRYFAECLSCLQKRDIVTVALALALYRAERGEYPQGLEGLTPEWLADIPGDRFTERPLVYRLTNGGYLLYSLGPDMTDGGGPNDDEDASDDIGVRTHETD